MADIGDDCYFYYYSTCTKGSSCLFRHCPEALGSEITCTLWQQGHCARSPCKFRHMEIQKKRNDIACYWETQPGGCTKPFCPFKHFKSGSQDAAIPPKTEVDEFLKTITKTAATSSEDEVLEMKFQRPVMQPVVINLHDEESDYESYASDGTPTKKGQEAENQQIISDKPDPQPVIQKQVAKTRNPVTTQRMVVPTPRNDVPQIAKKSQPTRISTQRLVDTEGKSDSEDGFCVKSLEQIRREKALKSLGRMKNKKEPESIGDDFPEEATGDFVDDLSDGNFSDNVRKVELSTEMNPDVETDTKKKLSIKSRIGVKNVPSPQNEAPEQSKKPNVLLRLGPMRNEVAEVREQDQEDFDESRPRTIHVTDNGDASASGILDVRGERLKRQRNGNKEAKGKYKTVDRPVKELNLRDIRSERSRKLRRLNRKDDSGTQDAPGQALKRRGSRAENAKKLRLEQQESDDGSENSNTPTEDDKTSDHLPKKNRITASRESDANSDEDENLRKPKSSIRNLLAEKAKIERLLRDELSNITVPVKLKEPKENKLREFKIIKSKENSSDENDKEDDDGNDEDVLKNVRRAKTRTLKHDRSKSIDSSAFETSKKSVKSRPKRSIEIYKTPVQRQQVTQALPAAPYSAGIQVRSIVRAESAAVEPRVARPAVVVDDRPDARKRLGGPATTDAEKRKPARSAMTSIKTFAEIMAEKRQRVLEQKQLRQAGDANSDGSPAKKKQLFSRVVLENQQEDEDRVPDARSSRSDLLSITDDNRSVDDSKKRGWCSGGRSRYVEPRAKLYDSPGIKSEIYTSNSYDENHKVNIRTKVQFTKTSNIDTSPLRNNEQVISKSQKNTSNTVNTNRQPEITIISAEAILNEDTTKLSVDSLEKIKKEASPKVLFTTRKRKASFFESAKSPSSDEYSRQASDSHLEDDIEALLGTDDIDPSSLDNDLRPGDIDDDLKELEELLA